MDKTLVKGVQLLEHLVHAGTACGVSELARQTGLNPSNVHRTLQTWTHLGFVAQDEDTGAYRCTLQLFEWGCRVADGFDVHRVARDHLAQLAHGSQETIHLSVLDGARNRLSRQDRQPATGARLFRDRWPRAGALRRHRQGTARLRWSRRRWTPCPSPLPRLTPKTVPDLKALRAPARTDPPARLCGQSRRVAARRERPGRARLRPARQGHRGGRPFRALGAPGRDARARTRPGARRDRQRHHASPRRRAAQARRLKETHHDPERSIFPNQDKETR